MFKILAPHFIAFISWYKVMITSGDFSVASNDLGKNKVNVTAILTPR